MGDHGESSLQMISGLGRDSACILCSPKVLRLPPETFLKKPPLETLQRLVLIYQNKKSLFYIWKLIGILGLGYFESEIDFFIL